MNREEVIVKIKEGKRDYDLKEQKRYETEYSKLKKEILKIVYEERNNVLTLENNSYNIVKYFNKNDVLKLYSNTDDYSGRVFITFAIFPSLFQTLLKRISQFIFYVMIIIFIMSLILSLYVGDFIYLVTIAPIFIVTNIIIPCTIKSLYPKLYDTFNLKLKLKKY